MKILRRYWLFIVVVVVDLLLLATYRALGSQVIRFTAMNFKEMLLIIPPVFIVLGLMDVWVPREMVVKVMGEGSGIRGAALAVFLGAAAAGPLYGAFPVAVVLTRKGASIRNVFLFLGAWATLKIPMFLFETAALGVAWSVTRWVASLVGIFAISMIIDRTLTAADREEIARLAQEIEVPVDAKKALAK